MSESIDWFGFAGTLVLISPPLRIEYSKWKIRKITDDLGVKEKTTAVSAGQKNVLLPFKLTLIEYLKETRDKWNGFDSLCFLAGVILISASFLKLERYIARLF